MTTTEPKMIEVYREKNLPEAHMIRVMLGEAGINATIDGDSLQSGLGRLPVGWQTDPRILVEESQAVSARQIVTSAEAQILKTHREHSSSGLQCLACGAEMADSDVKCSACGWTFADDRLN
jgi:hypothetical protein